MLTQLFFLLLLFVFLSFFSFKSKATFSKRFSKSLGLVKSYFSHHQILVDRLRTSAWEVCELWFCGNFVFLYRQGCFKSTALKDKAFLRRFRQLLQDLQSYCQICQELKVKVTKEGPPNQRVHLTRFDCV